MPRKPSAFGAVCSLVVLVACTGWLSPEPNRGVVRLSKESRISPDATIIEYENAELVDASLLAEKAETTAAATSGVATEAEIKAKEEEVKEKVDEEEDENKKATTFFSCLVALVLGTMLFDFVKESIVDYVEESQLAPVVDAMFGELTVLGFIGLVSFMLAKAKVFTIVSEQVYADEIRDATPEEAQEWKEKVPEIFENLHMMLFLVMVIFIVEVMFTIVYAKRIQRSWQATEEVCHDPVKLAALLKGWHPRDQVIDEKAIPAMEAAGLDSDELDFMMDYLSLRVEFITPRGNARNNLGNDFDFSDYMGHVMGIVLSGIVNVSIYEWLALLVVFTGFYLMLVFTECHENTLGFVMVAFVWSISLLCYVLDHKLKWVMKQLTYRPKARTFLEGQLEIMEASAKKNMEAHKHRTERRSSTDKKNPDEVEKKEEEVIDTEIAKVETEPGSGSGSGSGAEAAAEVEAPAEEEAAAEEKPVADEKTPLVAGAVVEAEGVPPYLLQEPMTKRNGCSELILGQLPNKHEQLFWFDRKGPKYNRMFIQVTLVLMAIYIPIQGALTIEAGIGAVKGTWNPWVFTAYVIITALPIMFVYSETMEVLSIQLLVCNVEMMRRRELVQKCKMSQRTAKVVRILQIINRLRQKAEVMAAAAEVTKNDPEDPEAAQEPTEEIDPKRRTEIEDIFDYFDSDNNGSLDASELACFMQTLGQPGNVQELAETLVDALDNDGNGNVEKDEFVAWMIKSEQNSKVKEDIHQIANKMFRLFDNDGDGFMTQAEFSTKMGGFGISLSEEELALLMRELDEDGTGRIEESDFRLLLERHDFEAE